MKLTIYSCDEHDHKVVFINGEQVISNDYCNENVRRIASYLQWEVEDIVVSYNEFEEKFA